MAQLRPSVGVYRSLDDISNFKVQVNLRRATGSGALAAASTTTSRTVEKSSRTISWQQKIFSQPERMKYTHKQNCETLLETEYHDKLMQENKLNGADGLPPGRIFTYIDHDDFENSEEKHRSVTTKATGPSFLVDRMTEVRQRHGSRPIVDRNTDQHPVITKPTARTLAHRVLDTPFQVMYIMADISTGFPDATQHNGEQDNIVLCRIMYDRDKVLQVEPDFNRSRPPYKVFTYSGDVYEYSLCQVNDEKDMHQLEVRDSNILKGLHEKKVEYLENRIGTYFERDENGLELYVRGELVQAHEFEYDNLYVSLLFELAPGWMWADKPPAMLTTQVCRKSTTNDITHFSFPFELHLRYFDSANNESSGDDKFSCQRPSILYQVNSLDYWNVGRIEGYGQVLIPLEPRVHAVESKSWRPKGTDADEMRRFFIGGGLPLEDQTYVRVPADHDGDQILNKFGFKTVASGTVDFRMNIIRQQSDESPKPMKQTARSATATAQNPSGLALTQSTAAILNAFKRAQRKSVIARSHQHKTAI